MFYDFRCRGCGKIETQSASIKTGPEPLLCEHCDVYMTRLYGQGLPNQIVSLDMRGYMEKAYRGEESVPQLSTKKVRAIMDSQVKTAQHGRANRRNYGDRR